MIHTMNHIYHIILEFHIVMLVYTLENGVAQANFPKRRRRKRRTSAVGVLRHPLLNRERRCARVDGRRGGGERVSMSLMSSNVQLCACVRECACVCVRTTKILRLAQCL